MSAIEKFYDEIPYNTKEKAGFPTRYFNLTVEQKNFVEALLSVKPFKDPRIVLKNVKHIRSAIEDIDYSLAAIEEEIDDRA